MFRLFFRRKTKPKDNYGILYPRFVVKPKALLDFGHSEPVHDEMESEDD